MRMLTRAFGTGRACGGRVDSGWRRNDGIWGMTASGNVGIRDGIIRGRAGLLAMRMARASRLVGKELKDGSADYRSRVAGGASDGGGGVAEGAGLGEGVAGIPAFSDGADLHPGVMLIIPAILPRRWRSTIAHWRFGAGFGAAGVDWRPGD